MHLAASALLILLTFLLMPTWFTFALVGIYVIAGSFKAHRIYLLDKDRKGYGESFKQKLLAENVTSKNGLYYTLLAVNKAQLKGRNGFNSYVRTNKDISRYLTDLMHEADDLKHKLSSLEFFLGSKDYRPQHWMVYLYLQLNLRDGEKLETVLKLTSTGMLYGHFLKELFKDSPVNASDLDRHKELVIRAFDRYQDIGEILLGNPDLGAQLTGLILHGRRGFSHEGLWEKVQMAMLLPTAQQEILKTLIEETLPNEALLDDTLIQHIETAKCL